MGIELDNRVFKENSVLTLDTKYTFILGKNGTGKSTIAEILKRESDKYKVSCFNGFENIIDEEKRLHAVVLGEDNTEINKKVEILMKEKEQKEKKKSEIEDRIKSPEDDSIKNIWTKYKDASKDFDKVKKHIDDFYTKSARAIKKSCNIVEQYNKNNFKNDIKNAKAAEKSEIDECKKIIKTEIKNAPNLDLPKYDLMDYLKDINNLLRKKVVEKTRINRLENNEKRKFAEKGLTLHKKGDVCAFCGSKISNDVFEELESYFSADDVKEFQQEILTRINEVNDRIKVIKSINVNENDFYPQYQGLIDKFKKKLLERVNDYEEILKQIQNRLTEKRACLFEECEEINVSTTASFDSLQKEYDSLMKKNNSDNLKEKQHEAKEIIRLNAVKEKLDEWDYYNKIVKLEIFREKLDDCKNDLNEEKNKVEEISKQIDEDQNKINDLLSKTRTEQFLVDKINEKLRNMVSFNLKAIKNKSNTYYEIEDIQTKEIRSITELSTGEKNIIALLYFLGKLDEIDEQNNIDKPNLVVFDDPMNSNDDSMQYLIMEELSRYMDNKVKGEDRFVLLTHNNHFYINMAYNYRGKSKSKKLKRIHLYKENNRTVLKEYTCEEDIKTSYDALWQELIFLAENLDEKSVDMMLNPMRRIIETFTKFNEISLNTFYSKVSGAKKLFDVNSHSIDDLQADLNAQTKEEIINIFRSCFEKNNFGAHFDKHWSSDKEKTAEFN